MRRLCYHWLISLAMFGLIIILASCGASNTGSTTATPGNGSNSTSNTTLGNDTSTLSFTASGGLSGKYMLTAPLLQSLSQLEITSQRGKNLHIDVQNDVLHIRLTVYPYTGPGSYTLSHVSAFDNSESMILVKGAKFWGGRNPLCPLTIASDTAATDAAAIVKAYGQGYDFREIKGSFTCSQVLSETHTDPSVDLSNGQFDVFVRVLNS